jgi:hypothetical protein
MTSVVLVDSDEEKEAASDIEGTEISLAEPHPASREQPIQMGITRSPFGPGWGTNIIAANEDNPAHLAAPRTPAPVILPGSGSVGVRALVQVVIPMRENRPLSRGLCFPLFMREICSRILTTYRHQGSCQKNPGQRDSCCQNSSSQKPSRRQKSRG